MSKARLYGKAPAYVPNRNADMRRGQKAFFRNKGWADDYVRLETKAVKLAEAEKRSLLIKLEK